MSAADEGRSARLALAGPVSGGSRPGRLTTRAWTVGRARDDSTEEGNAGLSHAEVEHAGVADDNQPRNVGQAPVVQDPRRLLRPDAGAVAGHERDHRSHIRPHLLSFRFRA